MKQVRAGSKTGTGARAGLPPPLMPITKKTTGIVGFDLMTGGGLPEGRLTAVVGGPGTGKSMFAVQYLLHRHREHGESGILVSFEESADRVRTNLASLDWKVDALPGDALTIVDARLPGDAVQSGAFDLSGLLAALSARVAASGARHVVLDGLDILIGALNDEQLERQEVVRIDEWVRELGLSGIVTVKAYSASERDQRRADLVQYLTDTVILLENTLYEADLSRTLRVVKYRGSGFAANAVPIIIGSSGLEVIPSGTLRGRYPVSGERVSSGVPRLDAVLGGGFLRGTSILVTGAPGTAKTSLSASLAEATCARGEKAVFISFDESELQIVANMKSIGIDLGRHVAAGRLHMLSLLSVGHTPEECFLRISEMIRRHKPACLIVDPMSAFARTNYTFAASISESLIDLAKSHAITFMGTSLLADSNGSVESSASHVSTIADVWLHLSYVVQNGERNRALTIVKARGTQHSNQVRELSLGADGIDLVDVYVGEGQVLLGSARAEKVRQERRREMLDAVARKRRKLALSHTIAELEARLRAATRELESKRIEAELEAEAELEGDDAQKRDLEERRAIRRQSDDLPPKARRRAAKDKKR